MISERKDAIFFHSTRLKTRTGSQVLIEYLRAFAGIVYAQLFCTCNAFHFRHTWAVFVQHSIACTLKCMVIYTKHTKSWETQEYRPDYGVDNVRTQEVIGCFDALHFSLRCLVVTPILLYRSIILLIIYLLTKQKTTTTTTNLNVGS